MKVGYQAPPTPEGKLMIAVFECAINDLFSHDSHVAREADDYIRNDLACLEVCGIDTEWARDVLRKLGVWK